MYRRRQKSRQSRQSRQRGGDSSCAAYPFNYAFAPLQQRGGMAPIDASYKMLDSQMAIQAEIGKQDAAFNELPRVLADAGVKMQHGGRRRHTKSRLHRKTRRHSKSRRHTKSRRHSKNHSRKQRGGMAPMDWSLNLRSPGANPQFENEKGVWLNAPGVASYSASSGAQA